MVMAQHAYWKGHIRLSLVSFPVRLYPSVTSSEKISLHKYDRESGTRIHYEDVNEAGERVEDEDIVKGYEYEKGSFVEIDDKDLKELKVESKHTIDLIQFTDMKSIDAVYYDKPYFVAPDGDIAAEAFMTIRDALRKSGKVALGQIVLNNKERIAVIKPCGKGLLLETLRYSYEVRTAEDYFEDIPAKASVSADQIEMAQALIDSKTAEFDPKKFKDRYQEGLKEIIDAKLEHRKPDFDEVERKPTKVVNIMDALKKSLAQSKGGAKQVPKTAAKPKKKTVVKKKRA
jgi:DNA end-binding protein Ku